MIAPNKSNRMEPYQLAKKVTCLAKAEGRALLAIADTCSMRDQECRKSLATLAKEHKDSVRQLKYGIHGRQREDGSVYYPGLLRRGIITVRSSGDGIPTAYTINLDALKALVYGAETSAQSGAQSSAQNEADQCTTEPEPVHKSPGTSAQVHNHQCTGALKVLLRSKESSKREVGPTPPVSNSKTSGQDKIVRSEAEVVSLVRDIQKAAMKATGGKARFFTEDLKTLSQDLRDRPNLTRDVLLEGVEDMNLGEMSKPQFAGREIATNLILTIESTSEARAERLKKDRDEKQLLDSLVERERRISDEEDRQRETRDAAPRPTAEELFGSQSPTEGAQS